MHQRNLRAADFTYRLPPERIATHPLPERDASRLLVYRDGEIAESVFRSLADHVPQGALMVFNDTRVLPARLLFQKETGGLIEVFCLSPDVSEGDVATAMAAHDRVKYWCMVGGASKWKAGTALRWCADGLSLSAEVAERRAGEFLIQFSWEGRDCPFAGVLELFGHVPLPPYLNRADEPEDRARYQSLLARHEGSVAAPTASLHFSEAMLRDLDKKRVQHATVTLHVGAGTFRPVKSETMQGHEMHAEWIDAKAAAIRALLAHLGPVVAVGTTALRTLESLYWMGCKAAAGMADLTVRQWDPYDGEVPALSRADALGALLRWMQARGESRVVAQTALLVAPGYRLRMAEGLVTNFHQPGSTLLLLVAALVGEDWRRVYEYALANGFRFLSYGDGSLLWAAGSTTITQAL